MRSRFPRSLARDQLRWLNLGAGAQIEARDVLRQRRSARALLRRLFGPDAVPGVILGDEVGMGKTYEALAVIAALFKHVPKARVVVLTHNDPMAKTWWERWASFRNRAVAPDWRTYLHEGELLGDVGELARGSLEFASYDRLKRTPTHELRCALERCFQGRWLRSKARRRLAWELLKTRIAPTDGEIADGIPLGALDQFWRDHYDRKERTWQHPWGARSDLRRLVHRASRTRRWVDLLVVDEAHKVASDQRSMFFAEVLRSRARRALYVTATPFSLSVDQLCERIADMHVVTGTPSDGLKTLEKDLEIFGEIVRSRGPLPPSLKRRLEDRLRRYLVRSLWGDEVARSVPRRKTVPLDVNASIQDEGQAHAMLALETAFVRLSEARGRTHSTTHRETLCSSYAAIREAAESSRARGAAFAPYVASLAAVLPSQGEMPKFEAVLAQLAELARRQEKAVVFCGRVATIAELRRALHARLRDEIESERNRWTRVRSRLRRAERKGLALVDRDDLPRLRLAVHRFGEVGPGREASALRRLQRLLDASGEPGEERSRAELWDQSWGPRRRIDWVGVLAGRHGDHEERRSPEAVQFAFNLPGPPYVLLCTEIAREGIDLHLWCRRVVQYDLEWNPALMEQQIGRVDRIGSLSRRVSRPVEVVWAWVPGTYEEYMARKVCERMEMMKVLLGAGEWLAASPEEQETVADLERYRLDFAP